jgi:D-beta-D-heptose 7-phosphate kinase/D-beta-D-heptose 1-phosphate adenosyltransferase
LNLQVFDIHEQTPLELIRAIKPEVLVKGSDYRRETVVGADLVESWGGRVYLADLKQGYSSTRLINRMEAA